MNKIKNIRNNMGLTQKQFSEYFNIPLRTIQKWEINQSNPPIYIIEMMEKIIKLEQGGK